MTNRCFDRSTEMLERAKRIIPLGSQTFSKSVMNFVEGASPLFLERGKGCRVWDVDGNEYVDYLLGLLPIVLGYCDPDVDGAIRDQLDRGIVFSLPTALEADLAERLVRLIPCAEKVRFGKNGSDATSAAIRLARAATGREKVIACGYHGWHDWYIGATSRSIGVPKELQSLTVMVPFNDLDRVTSLVAAEPDAYAAIILEPCGATEPQPGYLEGLRHLTEKYGIALVFDEVITGFRAGMGGAQAVYGVTPDMASFGKSMGNGMPISAIVGRAHYMDYMDKIFFSGTFGGEALSLAACIATIDKLERENAIARMHALGVRLRESVRGVVERHGLSDLYVLGGPDWWPRVFVKGKLGLENPLLASLMQQELIAAGLLSGAGLTFNLCLSHDDPAVEAATVQSWDKAVAKVAEAIKSGNPSAALRGKLIQPVFQVRAQ